MTPLPTKLDSVKDGVSTGPNEVFGEDAWENRDYAKKEANVVNSFYELAQLRPTIVSELASWGFLSFAYESAQDNYPDNEYLEIEDSGLLSEDETHEEWLKRLLAPALASPNLSSPVNVYDFTLDPFSFEMEGRLYTEFMTEFEHDGLLVVRDDNGLLRVFLWDSLDG